MTDIDKIWHQLQFAYGNMKHLLTKKLKKLNSMDNISRIKGADNIAFALTKILNLVKDLIQLAETHNIKETSTMEMVYSVSTHYWEIRVSQDGCQQWMNPTHLKTPGRNWSNSLRRN